MLSTLDTDQDCELDPIDFYTCLVIGMRIRLGTPRGTWPQYHHDAPFGASGSVRGATWLLSGGAGRTLTGT